jgi:hypothetical protein
MRASVRSYREPIRGPGDACNLGAFYSRLKKEPGELEARRAFVTAFRASEKEDLRTTNRSGSVAGDGRSRRSQSEVIRSSQLVRCVHRPAGLEHPAGLFYPRGTDRGSSAFESRDTPSDPA